MAAPCAEPSVGAMTASVPEERANKEPSGACLTDERGALDNTGFATAVLTAAAALAAAGLGTGEVLPLEPAPRIEFVTAMFAAWRLGAAVRLGRARTLPVAGAALILPGGVVLDQLNLDQAADSLADWYRMDRDTVSWSGADHLVPGIIAPLLAGGSVVLSDRVGHDRFWPAVERAQPTYFAAGPRLCAALLSRPGGPPSSLRYVMSPAAPLPAALSAAFEQRYGVPVVDGFGPDECAGCGTANPPYGIRKPGTAGLPLPGVDVAIADGRGRLLPSGVSGEVVMRGPAVMRGYLGRPAETARALRAGWLHTGTAGRFDQDGYLVLGASAGSASARSGSARRGSASSGSASSARAS